MPPLGMDLGCRISAVTVAHNRVSGSAELFLRAAEWGAGLQEGLLCAWPVAVQARILGSRSR
jgi:hypothetical protein